TAFVGLAQLQMRRYTAALSEFQAAQKIFESEGNLYWQALLELYRSEVELSLKRFSQVLALAARARDLFQRMDASPNTILSLVHLGRIAIAMDDVSSAQEFAAQIEALIEKTNLPLLLFPCYVLFADIAERRSEWEKAERFYVMAVDDLEAHQTRLHHDDL